MHEKQMLQLCEQKPEMPVECVSTGIVIAENRSGLTDVVLDIPR